MWLYYPLLPGYRQHYRTKVPRKTDAEFKSYLYFALQTTQGLTSTACELKGGHIFKLKVYNQAGQALMKEKDIWPCLTEPYPLMPEILYLHTVTGEITFFKLDARDVWGSVMDGAMFIAGAYFLASDLGPQLMGNPSVQWVFNKVSWVTGTISTLTGDVRQFVTDPIGYLKKKMGAKYDNTFGPIENIYNDLTTTRDNINKTINDDIIVPFRYALATWARPWIEPLKPIKSILHDLFTTQKNLLDTRDTVIAAVEKPLLALDKAFFKPLKLAGLRLDAQLAAIANYLALWGIEEGKDVRQWVAGQFSRVNNDLMGHYNMLRADIKKIQTDIANFSNLFLKPLDDKISAARAIIDRVDAIFKKALEEDGRMKEKPLQESLERAPETVFNILAGGLSAEIPRAIYKPIPIPKTLPEIQAYSDSIDTAERNLYVDSVGNVIKPGIDKFGKLTTTPADVVGEKVDVMAAIVHPEEKETKDLHAVHLLWSRAVDTGQVLDVVYPADKPEYTRWEMAQDLGLVLLPFGWQYYLLYEYHLSLIDTEPEDWEANTRFLNALEANLAEVWLALSTRVKDFLFGVNPLLWEDYARESPANRAEVEEAKRAIGPEGEALRDAIIAKKIADDKPFWEVVDFIETYVPEYQTKAE